CRTIALETGFQNAQLCSTIVQLSFSPAELELMFAFPLIYSIFQLATAVCAVAAFQAYKRICVKNSDDLDNEVRTENDDSATKQMGYALDNKAFDSDELKGTYTNIKL
ncbi:hypothetical protein ATANTOWER_032493, partial [Ataeniobius toweri]|nr:hypothetical protein [Ataeniobius toweri]